MGSAPALPHPLLTLPAPSLRSPRPLLALSSSSSASTPRLSVPRAPALGFSSAAALSPLIRRSTDSTASIARASAEDGQAAAVAGDADVAAEAEEESVESEAQEEGSSVPEGGDAEEKPPRKPRVKLGEIMGVMYFFCNFLVNFLAIKLQFCPQFFNFYSRVPTLGIPIFHRNFRSSIL